VYLSGVLGLDPSTHKLVDGDTVAQAKQAFINMKNILEAANSSYENGNVTLYKYCTNFIP
jgi:enamine deaminase RidA (YjgF/YER057c/UK114 family)